MHTGKELAIPLVSPMLDGAIDKESIRRLVSFCEPYVDIYVPCLSSGEGEKLSSSQWSEVVSAVRSETDKPVYCGILKEGKEEVQQYLVLAAKYGCEGVVIKVEMLHPNNGLDFSGLKLILYNQEGSKATAAELLQLSRHPQVVAIKDSSENVSLFNELSESLAREGSAVKLYQGMETTILQTPDADGMLISLANVEPSFCRKLLSEQGGKAAQELDGYIERYNLKDGQWYKSLKEALYSMKVINSPQLVGQE